jgi:DNA polymerase-1
MNDPVYTKALLTSDIHVVHQKTIGLSTRARAKTWIYMWLLGGGDEKAGTIAGVKEEEYESLFEYAKAKRHWKLSLFEYFVSSLREKKRKADKKTVATIIKGYKTKEQFLERTPALKRLKKIDIPTAAKQGYLLGLDGRKLWIPSEHLAMSLYLQGFEAVIMKQAMRIYHEDLRKKHIPFKQVQWTHDEFGVETEPECADEVGHSMVAGIVNAGKLFSTNCPLDGEYKIGPIGRSTWATTH